MQAEDIERYVEVKKRERMEERRWLLYAMYGTGLAYYTVSYILQMQYDKWYAMPCTVPARIADFILNMLPGIVFPGLLALLIGKATKDWKKVSMALAIWWVCYWLVDMIQVINLYLEIQKLKI